MTSEILIKGMVCKRCRSVIQEGLTNMGFPVATISLGKVTVESKLTREEIDSITSFLHENGFELTANRHARLVNQTKQLIDEVFGENVKHDPRQKFSSFLS